MQPPATKDDSPDFKSHAAMWSGFTSFMTKSIIGVIIVVLFVGWITGVL